MAKPWNVAEWTKNWTYLHVACQASHGNLDIVKLLVERNANVNQSNSYGVTPLMCSVLAGHAHIVRYLLDNGANEKLETIAKDSALSLALHIAGE
jgi:ankyrin repeat protein